MSNSGSIFLILLLLTADGYVFAGSADRSAQESDIREAVFLYQFDHNASAHQKSAHSYCVSIGNGDPSNQFMTRFAHHRPRVRKESFCHWGADHILDKAGKPALLFWVGEITWVSDTQVNVAGGFEEAGLSSSANTYTVEEQAGKWTVTHDQLNAISKVISLAPERVIDMTMIK